MAIGFRTRTVIISLILIVILSIWTIYAEHFVGGMNSISPPPGALLLFFFVVLINSVLRSLKLDLKESELILLYSLLLISAPISSFAVVRFFISILIAPFHFATPENEFKSLFHHLIPSWFAPRAPSVVEGYYEPLIGKEVPWEAWLKPLLIWLPFILIAYVFMLCLSIIIHKQWIDKERLTFPTVYLPLQLSEEPKSGSSFNSFLKNKFLWLGFAIPFLIHGLKGLSFYYPVIPSIPLRTDFARFLSNRPWNAVDMLRINFYPNVVGFIYLAPVSISFSCWFFYLLSKVAMVIGASFGWQTTSLEGYFPLPHYQSVGAFIALILFNLWLGRYYIISIFQKAFSIQPSSNTGTRNKIDADMVKLYRFGFIGIVIASAALVTWLSYIGMKPIVIIGFLTLFIIYSLSAGRIRTQAGLGAVSGPVRMDDFLRTIVGTRRMGPQNLTTLVYLRWMTIDLRGFMSSVPAQLESFKMSEKTSSSLKKRMSILIIFSVALALIVSCISLLRVSYETGAQNRFWMLTEPQRTFQTLRYSIVNPQGTDWTSGAFTLVGLTTASILAYLRTRFLWFPFHPIGYAVGFSRHIINWVWFSIFIGWGLKFLIIKFGGLKLNRKLTPMFLGLVLGDFLMAWFWCIVAIAGGGIQYQVFP